MIERIEDVPPGVIGIRASGKLTKDDYTDGLEPALKEATDSGEARVLFVLPDFDGLEPGAWIEDVKTGLKAETQNRSAWKKLAFVSGVEWVSKSMRLFTWAMPGELKVFEMDELDAAKEWVRDE
jgi:stage II sporulation SpoAA-like protein